MPGAHWWEACSPVSIAAGMCALKHTSLNGLQDMRLITDAASAMNIVCDRGATMGEAGEAGERAEPRPNPEASARRTAAA